ncbi:MAG TPA: hypothetical protein PLQ44_03065 [Candidatus Paceibacterota bacterium]|nr:hypothetical protein [Candidatus Paceibacterota bacterium]
MTEVWGELAKSQSDSEKIEEAVTRLISAHESDPDAHLGEGDSLQSHVASEIIDHRIGSVLLDKISTTEMILQTNFDSLDRWTLIGVTYGDFWPGVTLYCTDITNTVSFIYTEALARIGNLIGDKNSFFQSTISIIENDNKIVIFGNTYVSSSAPLGGYGFRWVNGVLVGFWDTNSGLETVILTGVTMNHLNVYRAQYDKTTQTVTFSVNGIVKGSIIHTGYIMDQDFIISFYLKTTTNREAYMNVVNLLIGNEV